MLPTFLRETRTTVERLEAFARNTDRSWRPAGAGRRLDPDPARPGRPVTDLEHLFRSIGPLTAASETGVPAADRLLEGVQPALESAHAFLPELNPILAYLAFSQEQIATFLAPGGSALGGNGPGRIPLGELRGALPPAVGHHRLALAPAAHLPAALGARELVPGPELLGAQHRARRDRVLRLQAVGRRGQEPVGHGGHRRAALLRGPAAAVPGPALPTPAPRPRAARQAAEGARRQLAGRALEGCRHAAHERRVHSTLAARSVRTSTRPGVATAVATPRRWPPRDARARRARPAPPGPLRAAWRCGARSAHGRRCPPRGGSRRCRRRRCSRRRS